MITIDKFINKLIKGNCIYVMKKIPDNSIDGIVTDPPNLVLAKHFSTRTYFKRNFGDLGIVEHFYKDFFKEFERILKDTGFFYIFCNESSYPFFWYYTYPFTKKIRILVWDKINAFNGYHWRHQHELIMFGLMPKSPKIKTGDGDIIRLKAVKVSNRKHPAEKPIQLLDKFIQKSFVEEQIVLDPFSGSGSTLKSCKKNGIKYIGIEYSNGYYEIAENELKNLSIQKSMK